MMWELNAGYLERTEGRNITTKIGEIKDMLI
jgi:hypothetical protein